MTQFLPPNLLALFAPREPIPFLPPPCKLPHEKKTDGYMGVGNFLSYFEDPKDTPPPTRIETREERKERKRREKAELVAYKLEQDIALWDPANNPKHTSDPYKTLFVARVNYDTSDAKLRREFEMYGPVRKVQLVYDTTSSKPRGYAFIEYEHERDMHTAYKYADGKKIDGRRVLVDVERGRTVKGWLPRRLGGGLGGSRKGPREPKALGRGEEDRYMNPDRERRRSRSRERRRRSRSRSKERGHRHRERRERGAGEDEVQEDKRERRRSRDRKRHRSRSRSRDRKRRDRREEPATKEESVPPYNNNGETPVAATPSQENSSPPDQYA